MSDWIENQNVIGGSTSKSVRVELVKTDGTPKTDAVYTDVTAYFYRPGDASITSITMATLSAIDSAYSSGGFKHISNGVCRFDPPNASIAAITGGGKVLFTLSVSGCFPCNFELTIVTENASTVKAAVAALNNVSAADVNAQCDTAIADAALATATNLSAAKTVVDAIKTKTDNLPASPAAVGSAMALTSAYDAAKTAAQASDIPSANITAIKAKTDNLPTDPADASDISSAFSTVNSTLTTIAVYIDTEVAAIKAKTDNIPASPAAVSDIPSAASVASAVRTELTTELSHLNADVDSRAPAATALSNATWTDTKAGYIDQAISDISSGGGTAPTAEEIADAVWDEAVSGHSTSGTTGAAIQAAGSSGDPWSTALPGSYADGTAGQILSKLNVGTAEQPVIVIPAAPADAALCRVYGYVETVDNQPASGVIIEFRLIGCDGVKSERLIAGRLVTVTTNASGQLVSGDNAYIDLQRNDQLTPENTYYEVTSERLGLRKKRMILTSETFDLSQIIEA